MALTVKEHNGFTFYVDDTGTYAGKVGATGAEVIPAIVSAGLVPGVKAPAERVINAPDPSAVVNTVETTAAENLMNNDAPVNLNQETTDLGNAGFSTGSPLPVDSSSELTNIQRAAQELKELTDTVGLGTRTKNRNDDRIVFFNDGTKTTDVLEKYGVTLDEWREATKVPGAVTGGISNRVAAVNRVTDGIDYALMSDEERQVVQEEYADTIDQQRKDDRKDERDQERFDALRDQVKGEAQALGLTTDEYYDLPLSQRLSMAASDIGEVFDPSQGSLFDEDSGRALGTLGSENLAAATKAAEDYYDDIDTSADSPFFEIPDVSGAVDDPMYGVGVYTPSDDDYSGSTYDDLGGALTNLPADAVDFDYPLAGGVNIPGTNITITAGDPVGPGAGSNTGDGDSNIDLNTDIGGDDTGGDVTGGGDTGINIGVIDPIGTGTGTGGGTGTGTSPTGLRESAYGLTLDDVLVPSTVNYGTDPRFANLAPTYNVSEAAMPVFAGPIVTPPVEEEETALLAQGGIVSLAGGGTPKGQGISPDFMVDTYYPSLIPKALDGNKAAKEALLEAHSKLDNFTLPEELLVRIKRSFRHGGVAERGYSHEGVGSLSDTARNMFRPMVS